MLKLKGIVNIPELKASMEGQSLSEADARMAPNDVVTTPISLSLEEFSEELVRQIPGFEVVEGLKYNKAEVVSGLWDVPDHTDDYVMVENLFFPIFFENTNGGTLSVNGERFPMELGDAAIFHPGEEEHSWDCNGFWAGVCVPVELPNKEE